MPKRFYVEQRASKDYPWQFVDIAAPLRSGPISIHKTKREAEKARDAHKRMLRRDAAEVRRRLARRALEAEKERAWRKVNAAR